MPNYNSTHTGSEIDGAVTKVNDSGVTQTELSYLDGLSSNVQTQLGLKAALDDNTQNIIANNITVHGTLLTKDSQNVNIGDAIITLNYEETGTPTENAGIEVERGTSTNVLLRWNETSDRWEFTNNGTTYYNIPISTEYATYVSSDFTHDDLSGVTANEHIDWTADQDSTNIHSGNYTNTTYSVVSTSSDGLAPTLPASHGGKFLRGDGTWVVPPDTDTVYTHPTTAGNKHIPTGGSSGQFLGYSASGTAQWVANPNTDTVDMGDGFKIADADSNVDVTEGEYVKFTTQQGSGGVGVVTGSGTSGDPYLVTLNYNDTNTTYSNATTSAAGLMSAADKTTFDAISTTYLTKTSPSLTASTTMVMNGAKISANSSASATPTTQTVGTAGQVLTSYGSGGGVYWSTLASTTTMTLWDGDTTNSGQAGAINIADKHIKFVEGSNIDINYTGSGTGAFDDPYNLTFAVTGGPYLPLAGGTMDNTNVVTNLNADLLDGTHLSAIYTNVNKLYENSTITYGGSYLQWTDLSGTGGAGTNGNAPGNPFDDWHHHLIMNHANSNGYYVDMAFSFHNNRVHFRRNVANSLSSWYEFWHTGNDGSGSGLDADTVDGIQGASFLRSDANDSASGDLTFAKRNFVGSSSNWDNGSLNGSNTTITNLHFQGHTDFWIGAGNSTWYTTATTSHHDLLINTMKNTGGNVRGITFTASNGGASVYRLGRWYSGSTQATSYLVVDGYEIAVDSSTNARLRLDSPANTWSYLRLAQSGSTTWDIASYNHGQLEFRPYGSGANSTTMSLSGDWTFDGDISLASAGYVKFPNTSASGISDAGGTSWVIPRDGSNNMHIRTSSGGIYLDTDSGHYFRTNSATEILKLDSNGDATVGGGSYTASHGGYKSFHAGGFSITHRTNYDCYIGGNTHYTASGWVNKYNLKSNLIAMANGQMDFYVGSGTTADGASNLTSYFQILSDGSAKFGGNVFMGGSGATFGDLGIENAGDSRIDLFSNVGSGTRGKAEIFFSTDSSQDHVSCASIVMEQPPNDQASRKGQIVFKVSDNGGPAQAMIIENNLNTTFSGTISSSTFSNHTLNRIVASNGNGRLFLDGYVHLDALDSTYDDIYLNYYAPSTSGLRIYSGSSNLTADFQSGHSYFYKDATFSGTIQNDSIWINDGTNYNSYNENIRLFNPANGVSVIAFSASGTSGLPTTSILGYSDRLEFRKGSSWRLRLYGSRSDFSGELTATADVVAYYSDSRLKDFHGVIENPLDKVMKLNGYYFTENEKAKELGFDNDRMQVGVSAQEVQEVLPELIKDAPIGHGYKTIDYGKLTPLLIEAIKEQQKQINQLKRKIGEA